MKIGFWTLGNSQEIDNFRMAGDWLLIADPAHFVRQSFRAFDGESGAHI
jgi:hypothetical protein